MKFSFNRKEILEILSKIQGVTSRKTTLTITYNVLIKAMDDRIYLTANDLETVFTGNYPAQVEEEGILCINSKKFFEIVREYPDEEIPVNEVENRWVEIGKGDSLFHIVSSDHKNFPETPIIEDVQFVEMAAARLKKVMEAASVIGFLGDEKRIYVIGALIETMVKDGQPFLRMVSTDSRRLHCSDAPFNGEITLPDHPVIVPKKGLMELQKFIDNTSEPIRVGIKDNYFIFKRVDESVMIKLLEGDYPDYKPVINTASMTRIDLNRALFSTLMRRVSILTSDNYNTVILTFRNQELTVSISNPEIGESKERINIGYEGEDIKSAFNPRYFLDAMNLFDTSDIELHIRDNRSPCIITGQADDGLVCAIMAMHIS